MNLREYVGTPYKKYDENGRALGCLLPFYLLYPDAPRFEWPKENIDKELLAEIKKHCQQVTAPEFGDLLVFCMPLGGIHISVYIGSDEMASCNEDSLETCRVSSYWRRLEGVYRWNS